MAIQNEERALLKKSWHSGDRMEAESLLKDLPIGSYLFRQDSFAQVLAQELEIELGEKVECFTVTFSQRDSMISDLTLVQWDNTWEIYNDDPSLEQRRFSHLKDLLEHLRGELKHPLNFGG
jgi:hypothetical protein